MAAENMTVSEEVTQNLNHAIIFVQSVNSGFTCHMG